MYKPKYVKRIIDALGYSKESILGMSSMEFIRTLDFIRTMNDKSHNYEEKGPCGGAFRDEEHYWEGRYR